MMFQTAYLLARIAVLPQSTRYLTMKTVRGGPFIGNADGGNRPAYTGGSGGSGNGLTYASAVIYPIILGIVCAVIYSSGQTSIFGLILGLVFAAALGVPIVLGGFYLIIIPLPFISFFKWGCNKPWLSTGKKLGLFGLCFLCVALMFLSLFLFA